MRGKSDEDQHGTPNVGNERNENQHDLHEVYMQGAWRMGRSCQDEGAACLENAALSSGAQVMYFPVVGWVHSSEILVARMGGVGRCRMFLGGSQTVWIGLGISRCGLSSWKANHDDGGERVLDFGVHGWDGGRWITS